MFQNKKRLSNTPAKDTEIEFFLTDANVNNSPVKIVRGIDNIPDWYKDLNSRTPIIGEKQNPDRTEFTIKRCIPVLDVLTLGYYIVTAIDYTFTYDEEKGCHTISGAFDPNYQPVSMHPIEQLGGMPFSSEYCAYAYKWINPYVIKTPAGYSCLVTHPANAPYLPFYTLSGVVDTDTYFRPINFPFLVKNTFNGVLPAGTPIAQITPFKRDEWSSKIITKPSDEFKVSQNLLTEQYQKDRHGPGGKEVGGVYKKLYRVKKRYL
jgi:hypothetical protein